MIDAEANAALCIHPYYERRPNADAFDDRPMRAEWQRAVYQFARDYARRHHFRSVVDFGCGSGFKLMRYFSGFQTIGVELEPCLTFLRETYPDRDWREGPGIPPADILVCADVIEHMRDPVSFLQQLACAPIRAAILSTPALEILAERGQSPRLGPPNNRCHVNEWTTLEFGDFIAMHMTVTHHIVVSARQGTQLIVALPR